MTIAGTDTTEKTVIVPPTIERPFWVKGAETSAEYLEEMSRYLSTLVLNVTPKSIDANIDIFLRYVHRRPMARSGPGWRYRRNA